MSAVPKANGVKLSWGPATNATEYKVRLREAGTSSWKSGPTTANTQKKINDLMPSTTYEWEVQTRCDGIGRSGFSQLATFTTLSSKELLLNPDPLSMEIYPNPSTETATVSLSGLDAYTTSSLLVRDMVGKVVMQQAAISATEPKITIDLRTLAAGFYIVEIQSGSQTLQEKLIKQ